MNKILCCAIFLIFYNITIKAQDTMVLTARQQALSWIAALEAKGDVRQLYEVLDKALNERTLNVAEEKEALSQLYAYTGFPRSLNALGQLEKVVNDRQVAGKATDLGHDDATAVPEGFDALKEGTDVQASLFGGKPFKYAFSPRTDYYLKAHLFGDIFSGKVLTRPERELVTVSALAALPGCEAQLSAHCGAALAAGLTEEEIASIAENLTKIDEVAAGRVREAIASVLKRPLSDTDKLKKGIEESVWPVGSPNSDYARYFDGESYLAPLGGNLSNVTFEPGCRNHWHVHHGGVQVLIVVAGRGWYQEWGKAPMELRPGSVVPIPEGVKHWHGAAKDSWMQHLTYMTDVKDGASNEWLEAVDGNDYNKLP